MTTQEFEQLKREVLAAKERILREDVTAAQAKLFDKVVEDFISNLKGDDISNSIENVRKMASIEKLWDKFVEEELIGILRRFALDLLVINSIAQQYYSGVGDVGSLPQAIDEQTYSRLGIDDGKLVRGGFLDSFVKDPTIKTKIKQLTHKAIVSQNITREEYTKSVKSLIKGDPNHSGALERHFDTFIYDVYAQNDRATNYAYGRRLNLDRALYAGGLIKESRDFCIVRDGKVFTTTEIERFGTPSDAYGGYTNKSRGEFRGKPPQYDPFIDCGGYRCRHTLIYVDESF